MTDDLFFFGNSSQNLAHLKSNYPNLNFNEIKQEHGSSLVKASDHLCTADAQWTDELNRALVIKTADCLPILISHPQFICAIHAGWKGVLNEIVTKVLHDLFQRFGFSPKALIHVGPHIQRKSFEISEDLFPQFEAIAQKYNAADFFTVNKEKPGKRYVCLSTLVQAQLRSCGVSKDRIVVSDIDTMTNTAFHSYRRDKESSGRNLSFVARRR